LFVDTELTAGKAVGLVEQDLGEKLVFRFDKWRVMVDVAVFQDHDKFSEVMDSSIQNAVRFAQEHGIDRTALIIFSSVAPPDHWTRVRILLNGAISVVIIGPPSSV